MKAILTAGAVALGAATVADAASVTAFTDRTAFEMAAGALSIETFEGVTDLSAASYADRPFTVGDLTLRTSNVPSGGSIDTFNAIVDDETAQTFSIDVDGTDVARVMTFNTDSVFTITFASAVTAFGFDTRGLNNFDGQAGVSRTSIVVADQTFAPVDVGVRGSQGPVRFLGYVSDEAFQSVSFIRTGRSNRFGIDNVAYTTTDAAPVPVPASLPLLAVGMGALAWMRRRLG